MAARPPDSRQVDDAALAAGTGPSSSPPPRCSRSIAAYLGYGAAGRGVQADARAAQARGDCPAAIRGFDLVTGPFELTLSRDVLIAAALRAECTAFLDARQAQEQRRYADAWPPTGSSGPSTR